MASPSLSSNMIPTSFSQSWNHDVFLSFRGEDTRKKFVDHLYTALVQQGIDTYKDDETLARGELIGPSLLKAIRESRIAVVIFSKNYADSSWCLDELAYIIECMDTRGQIVMPIFYEVDPSDVRKLNGNYEEAFVKHELEHKQKVESWRRALVKSGNLSGWVSKDFANGHEANFIKKIIGTISIRLSSLITNINKDLIGIEIRLQGLKSKLEIGTGGVRMVGIWGVGGGGKTTLASAAYMEISHQFEAHCLLENIRDESSKHGLKRLQERILSALLKKEVVLQSELEGKSMIKRRLCHKSVLVVLDDVDDLKQLEALAGLHDWFGEGSRIIITTRDEHLLSRKADFIYEVSLLSHNEAIKLFSRHAYRKDKPIEDYERLSLDVVSYAGGFPLALEIIGSFLYDKDNDEWMSALAKLKCIPHVKVTERLKISYDGLEHDEKELFLDIACFLRRWPINPALEVLDACSFHPGIGVKVLVQKSLIKVSNGIFHMHDLVEEMAHYIVRGEHPAHPEKHSRIWQEEDALNLFFREARTLTENNHTEVIFVTSDINHPRLPHVISNMKKLRWIYMRGYPASLFPASFQPTKLGCLMLEGSRQKQLWQGCKHLPSLKLLDLGHSHCLTSTPDFVGLPYLERLILEDCESLEKIHPSFGYHERLVYVNMNGCKKLKMFPPIIRMKKLVTLELSGCSRLQKFPDIQTHMDSLVKLILEFTSIDIIPASLGEFCTNLVSFDSRDCHKLKRIDGNFRLLKHLKILHLSGCDQLEKLAWDFFGKECCLEVLSLSIKGQDSRSFNSHKNYIGLGLLLQNSSVSLKLPQFPRLLRKLDLSGCHLGDGDIPSDLSEMINLQVLDLSHNTFSQLHSSLSRIPCLKFLNLSSCQWLVALPDLPSSIAILRAEDCNLLQTIGDLSIYKWLWKISLWRKNNKLIVGGERVVHSVLQGNGVEDRFMSVILPVESLKTSTMPITTASITLQLPHNWYSDFSGFLFCVDTYQWEEGYGIVIKQEMSMNSQLNHHQWEEYDKNDQESFKEGQAGYVPFASLTQISWWNLSSTNITFEIECKGDPKVLLVPRKSKTGDSRERATVCSSEFWDKESEEDVYRSEKTFEIKDDPKSSSIYIEWCH
ncbi:hypothetical protein SSX86_017425 [Deinandra increscens subsp. villosa]|uniref:TIR domain-containing protein n=1 Tax=Deinandra increscens subsp. villosa TaxID=3103831 RepID=A0AAP0GYI9_9ASTR